MHHDFSEPVIQYVYTEPSVISLFTASEERKRIKTGMDKSLTIKGWKSSSFAFATLFKSDPHFST